MVTLHPTGVQLSSARISQLEEEVENAVAKRVAYDPDLQISEVVTALLNVVGRYQYHQVGLDIDVLSEAKQIAKESLGYDPAPR